MTNTIGTAQVPIYAKVYDKEYVIGSIDFDLEAGEPVTGEDGVTRVPLKLKDTNAHLTLDADKPVPRPTGGATA